MSTLIDYLDKIEQDVLNWPTWKKESLNNAFQIPSSRKYTMYKFISNKSVTFGKYLNNRA